MIPTFWRKFWEVGLAEGLGLGGWSWRPYVVIPGFGGGLGGGSGRRSGRMKRFLGLEEVVWEVGLGRPYVAIPGFGDVRPLPGGGEAASLLGTSPEQRKRSMPSGIREVEASGCLRFPLLWDTSGLSLAAVRLRLSWGCLRSSENAACRRAFAKLKPLAGLGFPRYGRRLCGV